MTTLETYNELAVRKGCAFGRAKIGKTALVGQLARIWNLWWFDLEDGIKTLMDPTILAPEFRKNIHVFRIPTKQSAPMGIETLLKVVKGGECRICWLHGKVKCPVCESKEGAIINRININELGINDCVVIDSSTQLTADANAASLAFILKDAELPDQFVMDKDSGGKNFKYPQAVTFMLDKIFSTLQTAHFNSFVISHEVMTETLKDTAHAVKLGENQPSTGTEAVFPAAGSRNFSRNFGRYFDVLIHLDKVNKKHRAYSSTGYSDLIQTGSRLGVNIEDFGDISPFDAIVKMFDPSLEAVKERERIAVEKRSGKTQPQKLQQGVWK